MPKSLPKSGKAEPKGEHSYMDLRWSGAAVGEKVGLDKSLPLWQGILSSQQENTSVRLCLANSEGGGDADLSGTLC